MTDDTMERYVSFICNEILREFNVVLNEPKRLDGTRPPIKKIGPRMKIPVQVSIGDSYTRSSKLKLTFDKYEVEDIFYMSRHKGPDQLLEEIYKKIDKIVNKVFIEDGREEEIREWYNLHNAKFAGKLKEAFSSLIEKRNDRPE